MVSSDGTYFRDDIRRLHNIVHVIVGIQQMKFFGVMVLFLVICKLPHARKNILDLGNKRVADFLLLQNFHI